jgi:hypothetical protein
MEIFHGAHRHDAYVAWRDSHPDGFILHSNDYPTNTKLMLHRTSCFNMTGPPASGDIWTNYPKWCSSNRDDLLAFARKELSAVAAQCAHCQS